MIWNQGKIVIRKERENRDSEEKGKMTSMLKKRHVETETTVQVEEQQKKGKHHVHDQCTHQLCSESTVFVCQLCGVVHEPPSHLASWNSVGNGWIMKSGVCSLHSFFLIRCILFC